mgnify:CR=1 FL=1
MLAAVAVDGKMLVKSEDMFDVMFFHEREGDAVNEAEVLVMIFMRDIISCDQILHVGNQDVDAAFP